MLKHDLARLLRQAIEAAQANQSLPPCDLPEIVVTRPKDPDHGDYASPIALNLKRATQMAPLKIAAAIIAHLDKPDYIDQVNVAPPGFINIRLADGWLGQQVAVILQAGETFGRIDLGHGRRAQVEFISANPTGPLTFGSGRNAVIGDVLASVLTAAGYSVEREYYLNDTGNQMEILAKSLRARYVQALDQSNRYPFPENGYPGDYLIELGQTLAAGVGEAYLNLDEAESLSVFRREALKWTVARIRADCQALNIEFDGWFSEQSLYDDGTVDLMLKQLHEGGQLIQKEGALWLKGASEEDKDSVVVRSDGRPTYFASDIAYLYDKLIRRRFDWAIYVLGADHHGYVNRMQAAARALGCDEDRLTIVLYQLVALERDGKPVRMGKRSEFISLAEVIDEIGSDATRFMLLTRSTDSQMTLDLGLAVQTSNENPVHYVRYAHARIVNVIRFATEKGINPATTNLALLQHPAEMALIRQMLRLEEVIELAAQFLAPHHLTHYAQELATAFHKFYHDCQIVGPDLDLSATRLSLVKATQITLANTLHLMGASAPEQM